MQLFSDYIQPIIFWLQLHPYWALFFTFLISFAESLAIIGSIVPGSVTMTAIGILAGSGVLRIDLTLLAAIFGAIGGDSFSYLMGHLFSDKLYVMWPFRNYPSWLSRGKSYFAHHGGKSVIVGRFIGPLRSIIPLIAGMMHMSQWRFFSANVISAIGWSLLYVLPGVAIGAASNDLSSESATRLFIFVLVSLGVLWFLSVFIRWFLLHINRILRAQLYDFWSWSRKHPRLAWIINFLTPANEKHLDKTATLCLYTLISILLFSVVTIVMIHSTILTQINPATHLFLQSLRIVYFDVFFIIISAFNSPLAVLFLALFVFSLTAYYRAWRSFSYWFSLHICTGLVIIFIYWRLSGSELDAFLDTSSTVMNYPAFYLSFLTAQLTMLLLYLNQCCKQTTARVLSICCLTILLMNGLAAVYLGDNELTDIISAYLCGLSISLLHWIFYRRYPLQIINIKQFVWLILGFLLAPTISLILNYEHTFRSHQPYFAQYVLTDKDWWGQKKPLLPLYRPNRIGKPINLFNVQYVGKLNHLETSLIQYGWHTENESLFWSLLKRLNGAKAPEGTPLMAQLYLNKKPVLIMTYQHSPNEPVHILRLWRSNYHLTSIRQPIWIGTVTLYSKVPFSLQMTPSLTYFGHALSAFKRREILLNIQLPSKVYYPFLPSLLLIKESILSRMPTLKKTN